MWSVCFKCRKFTSVYQPYCLQRQRLYLAEESYIALSLAR